MHLLSVDVNSLMVSFMGAPSSLGCTIMRSTVGLDAREHHQKILSILVKCLDNIVQEIGFFEASQVSKF